TIAVTAHTANTTSVARVLEISRGFTARSISAIVSNFGAVLVAGAARRSGDDADGVRAVGIGAGAPPTAVTNGSSAAITSSADAGRFAGDFSRSFHSTRSTPRGSCDRTSSGSGG